MNDLPGINVIAPVSYERGHRLAVDIAKGHGARCPGAATACPQMIDRLYVHTAPNTIAYETRPGECPPPLTSDTPMFNVSFMSGDCHHVWRPRVDEIVEIEQTAHGETAFKMRIRRRTEWDPPENLLFLMASCDGPLVSTSP